MEQEPKQRTPTQNRAAHLYFKHVADQLNDSGWTMQKFLAKRVGIRWTEESVKEAIFKVLAKAMYNVESSTQLNTKQFTDVAEMMAQILAKDYGIATDFPSLESLMLQQQLKK